MLGTNCMYEDNIENLVRDRNERFILRAMFMYWENRRMGVLSIYIKRIDTAFDLIIDVIKRWELDL